MGIHVKCPKGHVFTVKDKYAGKKGLCPHCHDQTVVQVPDLMSTTSDTIRHGGGVSHPPPMPETGSIFDDPLDQHPTSSSGSLLSGSFIQHKVACPKCSARIPMWYAKCPSCGEFIEHT